MVDFWFHLTGKRSPCRGGIGATEHECKSNTFRILKNDGLVTGEGLIWRWTNVVWGCAWCKKFLLNVGLCVPTIRNESPDRNAKSMTCQVTSLG